MQYVVTFNKELASPYPQNFIQSCHDFFQILTIATTIFSLAQRVKKKIKALFGQIVIHLARLLGETIGGKPPDHQDDEPEKSYSHWWKEIKIFVKQIKAEGFSESQLLKILEDDYSIEDIYAIFEALRKAAEKMEDLPPKLFQ